MDENELLEHIKNLVSAQQQIIKVLNEQVNRLGDRVKTLENATIATTNTITRLQEENNQIVIGYNDILSKINN